MGTDGQVASGTQTAYVLALHMNLVPDDLRAAAAERLVAAIRAADWHLTTGFAGVGYLLPVLSSAGHTAMAYRLLEQASPPSSLGSVGEWFYWFLLGIDQEPGTAGFGRLLRRPHPGGSLDWTCDYLR